MKIKNNQITANPFLLLCLSLLSNTSSFLLVALRAAVCHTIYPLSNQPYLQMFIAMNHLSSSRPLVCGTPSSLCPHRNSSRISHICPNHENPAGIVPQDQSLHALQQDIDGLGVKVDQPKALGVDQSGSWAGHSGPLRLSPSVKGQTQLFYVHAISSPKPMVRVGSSFPWGSGSAVLLQCLEIVRDRFPRDRQGWDHELVPWFQHACFLWLPMVTWAADINTDPATEDHKLRHYSQHQLRNRRNYSSRWHHRALRSAHPGTPKRPQTVAQPQLSCDLW